MRAAMMRDIKHNSEKERMDGLPPLEMGQVEEIELFEASQVSKDKLRPAGREAKQADRPRGKATMDLSGRTVPLAAIRTDQAEQLEALSKKNEPEAERPLFATTPLVKKYRIRMGKGERKIMLGLIGLVVVATLLAGVVFLPTAKITLKLRTAPLLVDEEVLIGQASGNNNVVPGTSFYREIAVNRTQPVQHREMVGSKSGGVVEIVNNTTSEQRIKEFSRLQTGDGVMFLMQKYAFVPPGGRVKVEALAAEEGSAGNIEPQRLDFVAFDDDSKQVVFGEAKQSFTGGSGELVAVVGADDLAEAKTEAINQARQEAEQQIKKELPSGWELLEESWQTEVIDFASDNNEGDKVPAIDYSSRVTVRVLGFEQAVFEDKMKEKLTNKLDRDYMLFPGPISFSPTVENINWDEAQAKVAVRVTHSTIPNLAIDTLRQKLAGRSVDEAQQYLEGLSGVRSATMELWPWWVKSIPRIEQRVEIIIESEKKI